MAAVRELWLEEDPAATIAAALRALQRGETVLFPTDTVYGLLALATSARGYARIYEIKGRERAKPMQLLSLGAANLAQQALALLTGENELSAEFRAGRITLVAEAGELPGLPRAISLIQPGAVGIRLPAFAPLRELLAALGPPHLVWATSANLSGAPSCTTAAQALEWLAQGGVRPRLAVLSHHPCPGVPSAVVRITGDALQHLR